MTNFTCSRPQSVAEISLAKQPEAKFVGGGTNLVDLMKMGVERPSHLIDVSRLPLSQIVERADVVRVGASAANSTVAAHPLIRERYPLLTQAILSGASPQIRNMATTAGNLMQRTRCYYFYDPSYAECNKRQPGSGCAALTGFNRIHAIVGGSDQCIATYPGDMAVALTALEARVMIQGPGGERMQTMEGFYRLPGATPQVEHDLQPGEIITAIELPARRWSGFHYLKLRDRNSFAFALVSVAALVDKDEAGRLREVRLALGGVAPRPWRVREAEESLRGKSNDKDAFLAAANIALREAKPLRFNGFKVELARRAIARAFTTAYAGQA
jgi:xanthine dehydrogenase YagS FAD-binding subunit